MTKIRFEDGRILEATPDEVHYFVDVLKVAKVVEPEPDPPPDDA